MEDTSTKGEILDIKQEEAKWNNIQENGVNK